MARANKRKWVDLVAGLLVGAAVQPLALLAGPDASLVPPRLDASGEELVVAQLGGGAARARVALNGAIDAQRQGDLDRAAALFTEAQARANDLTPDERRELDHLLAANARAMKGREDARGQLGLAETAMQKGRADEAASLVKQITANELYLSPADKQRFRGLCQKLHVQPAGAAAAPTGNPVALANSKLQQARAEMSKANLDAAEALAREVDQLHVSFGPRDDSPRRVLEDLDKARKDPKTILLACRAALRSGELDRAEQYALAADKLASPFTFSFFGDSPAKALKDIQTARANDKGPGQPGGRSGEPSRTQEVPRAERHLPAPPGDSAKARSLVQQGRQALAAGDLAQARKCAEQAAAQKAELSWSEDNPARLLDDIVRAEPGHSSAPAPAGAPIRNKDEAMALLKQGREQFAKGELDEAYRTASRLQAARHIHWGLFFEDTPDKLLVDVKHARDQRDKEKSVELMAEARRAFEKKDYDTAERLAHEAQKRHGNYGILDLGDRPVKLIADIQTQREKERRVKLPDPPVTNRETADLRQGPLAQQPGQPANNAVGQGNSPGMNGSKPPVDSPAVAQARMMLKDARMALQRGETDKARMLADGVRAMHVVLNAPGDDSPENIYRDIERMAGRTPPMQLTANTTRQGAPSNMGGNNPGDQARARQLVAEARMMLQQNRLVEAREKLVASQRLGAAFRPDEDNPNQLLQQTAFLARQRIDSLIHHAGESVRYGTQAPAVRCQEAEKDLAQARQLALAFGQDMQPIERTLLMVNQLRTTGNVTLVGAMTPSADLPPTNFEKVAPGMQGPALGQAPVSPRMREALQKLDQARLELRNGDTSIARRLAEEAINGGAREQGLAVLRSIDAEERGQQALSANRAFDAVVAAYHRREYRQASLMLGAIDIRMLNARNHGRLREMLNTPEMRPAGRGDAIALTGAQEKQPPSGKDASFNPQLNPQSVPRTPESGGTGRARATDDADQSMLARTKAMREIKFQQLRDRGMKVQSEALERFRSGQTDEALAMLQDYLGQLAEEQLDPGQLSLLRRSVESRMQQFKIMKAQVDFANNANSSMKTFKQNTLQKQNTEQVKQRNVADLMKQYNELFRLGKYADAEALALRVKELDPDNPMAAAAVTIARTQRHVNEYRDNKRDKEDMLLNALNETDREGDPRAVKEGMTFETDPERVKRIQGRKSLDELSTLHMPRKTSEEKNIERKLTSPVSLNVINQPLRSVFDDLRATQGVNIYVDEPALAEKGINQDLPVTIKLEQISLKSALNLLLHSVHLTYVVGDDVLKITTEDHARGKLEQRVVQVTDLVLAVENYDGNQTPMEQLGAQTLGQPGAPAPSPITGTNTLTGGQQIGTPTGSMAGGAGGFAADAMSRSGATVTKTRAQTHEDMLIKLITNTIQPRSWAEQGGPGTIDYHPLTMSLIINQTPDIQDQVADLLAALRRLQDQEVAVEVKFISIAEDFFERIGVNFNMNIVNNHVPSNIQNQLTSGQFQLPGLINQFAPSNGFISGLTPAGTLTSDLNIPITQLTYPQAIPPFGGYPGIPGFGGLTLGLAFLSDIQVFLFMEAVQGDIRSNVMQAPKLTLFNGQTGNIQVQDFQFFVVGVQVIPQLGQFTYFPQTTLFPLGVQLTIQAVISADRRFVRLSLTPQMSNVVNGEVNLFPVVTPIFPLFDGTATGQPVVFTQFVQQPRLTRVSVQTTVAVPDGGTVLMGGLKRLSEGRNEYGPPIISKIPYLNRLFRNTAYGRSAESLLIMVTPRIIIQAEEEEKQTGYVPPPAVVP
ncbi:MAG TPA: hypothetical protein VH643_00425 [Gemmataceae bacterium]